MLHVLTAVNMQKKPFLTFCMDAIFLVPGPNHSLLTISWIYRWLSETQYKIAERWQGRNKRFRFSWNLKGEEAFASWLDSYKAMDKTSRFCMVFSVLNELACQQFVVEVTHGFGVDYRQLNKRSKKMIRRYQEVS